MSSLRIFQGRQLTLGLVIVSLSVSDRVPVDGPCLRLRPDYFAYEVQCRRGQRPFSIPAGGNATQPVGSSLGAIGRPHLFTQVAPPARSTSLFRQLRDQEVRSVITRTHPHQPGQVSTSPGARHALWTESDAIRTCRTCARLCSHCCEATRVLGLPVGVASRYMNRRLELRAARIRISRTDPSGCLEPTLSSAHQHICRRVLELTIGSEIIREPLSEEPLERSPCLDGSRIRTKIVTEEQCIPRIRVTLYTNVHVATSLRAPENQLIPLRVRSLPAHGDVIATVPGIALKFET